MDKVKQVVDKVVHPKDHSSSTHSTTGTTHGTGVTGTHGTAGPHSSDLANKGDIRVDSDRDGSRNMGAAQYGAGAHNTHGTTGLGSSTTSHSTGGVGPQHSANLNRIDPSVDSDLDGSRNMGAARHGPGAHTTGTTGTTGYGSSTIHGTATNGPHNSKILNSLDPTVDSDRDGSRNMGMAKHGPGAHTAGTTGTTYGTTTAGSHNSAPLKERMDPRVDSDRDGSRNMGMAQHGPGAHTAGTTGTTGTTYGATTHGTTNASLGQKLDPRIDSDLDGSRNMGMAQEGPGAHATSGHSTTTGSSTTGPHSSSLMNKLDPRVSSNPDASRTVGNQGY